MMKYENYDISQSDISQERKRHVIQSVYYLRMHLTYAKSKVIREV